jgi:hypothetical protein
MTGLITESQMQAIRSFAEKGMVTTVEIYRRDAAAQPAPANDYGDNVEYNETTASRRGTVQGWLRTVPAPQAEMDSGAIVTDTVWELRVPAGTEIVAGDEVIIKGVEYNVASTDSDNTLLPYIKCSLRTREG